MKDNFTLYREIERTLRLMSVAESEGLSPMLHKLERQLRRQGGNYDSWLILGKPPFDPCRLPLPTDHLRPND